MALEQMFEHLKTKAQKEIDQQINSAKVEITKNLVALGESLEDMYYIKKEELVIHLKKKESTLKTEKEFQYKTKILESERLILEQITDSVYKSLQEFPKTNITHYHTILKSWFHKASAAMNDSDLLTIRVCDTDQIFFKKEFPHVSVKHDPLIKSGFIMTNENGETIDLSFDTLFQDRKQQILQHAMQIVKETL